MAAAARTQLLVAIMLASVPAAPAGELARELADRTCGVASACPDAYRFIDLPTYFINLDADVRKAARMRAQLGAHLAPGVCATRVRAVRMDEVDGVIHGDYLARLGLGASRPLVEYAIMASHLKAAYLALSSAARAGRDGGASAAGFLILEDDMDVSPLVHFHAVGRRAEPAGAAPTDSLGALARTLPRDWSLLQLMAVMEPNDWRAARAAWSAEAPSRAAALDKRGLTQRGAQLGAPCWTPIWSAGAYVLSAAAAAMLMRLWPVSAAPAERAGVRVRVERSCVSGATRWAECAAWHWHDRPAFDALFISDHCIVNLGTNWPPLSHSEWQAEWARAREGAAAAAHVARANGTRWREYIATPPWFTDCASAGSVHGAGRYSRAFTFSREATYRWWTQLCVKGRADAKCSLRQRAALRDATRGLQAALNASAGGDAAYLEQYRPGCRRARACAAAARVLPSGVARAKAKRRKQKERQSPSQRQRQ